MELTIAPSPLLHEYLLRAALSSAVEGSATEEEAHLQLPDISLGCCALTKGNARRMLTL